MSLLQGFASVNTDEPAAGQQAQTLEAREARAISLYEQTLALIQAQQAGQAEVTARLRAAPRLIPRLRPP